MRTHRAHAGERPVEIGRWLFGGVLLVAATLLLGACQTVEGFGRDVGTAGDTLADTAEDTREQM
jgi:predicted small secreted protein